MPNNDLAIRFSDEMYATKNQVAHALNTSLIDNIWTNILNYRSNFTRVLSLKSIEKTPLSIVLTPSILEKISTVERKLTKAMVKYEKVPDGPIKESIKTECYARCLECIAKKLSIDASPSYLKTIASRSVSSISPDMLVLNHYLDALKELETHSSSNLDEDLLVSLYTKVCAIDELISLYRQTEIEVPSQKAIIGKTYVAAPVKDIEDMVNDLIDFVNHSNFSFIVKAIISFYYLQYIKPFDVFNEEIALLFSKAVIAHGDIDAVAALLGIETLIAMDKENVNNIFAEVQKTYDLTYFLVYALDVYEHTTNDLLDVLASHSTQVIKQEYYSPREEEDISLSQPVPEVTVAKETSENVNNVQCEVKVAIPALPVGFSEEDAEKVEEHLLEINPRLKHGEAYFYARHCTLGKYYTIAQYKKVLTCAYETARTSMDHLVLEGYYRKEMIKNKYVYTPVQRR